MILRNLTPRYKSAYYNYSSLTTRTKRWPLFRRSARDFLRDNLFWVITFIAAIVITAAIYFLISLTENRTELITENAEEGGEKFVITCFEEKMGLMCKSPGAGGHCSADFKKNLKAICSGMEALDIEPLGKIAVGIRKYDVCDKKLEEQAGCMPHFILKGETKGYGAGFIYLPASLFNDKESLRIVLIHEMTHALTSKMAMTRIVKEFFAIYTQIQFYDYNFYKTCNGAEWNQPALRNYGGEYIFPPKKDHRPMDLLSTCRYGQLEHIVRELHRKSPFLFGALWYELKNGENERIDTAWIRRKITEIDREAGKIVSRYYILSEADASPQLAIIGNAYEHCAFIYKNAGASEEYYSEKAGFQMEWRRGKKHMVWKALSRAPLLCYPADSFSSGDIVSVRAVGFGKSFFRLFIVP